jgi:pyridoxal phosphate enzyme (YggS family)
MNIRNNITNLRQSVPSHCTLVAVSKTKPVEAIQEAYEAGQRVFGENKAQELTGKYEVLPKDIEWHMIGHMQSNKVKYIAPFVSLIHSVDSFKLLEEINKQGAKINRVLNCLLQIHIAEEETKFGFSEEEIVEFIKSTNINALDNIQVVGLMGMATFTDNVDQVRKEFRNLKMIFEKIKSTALPKQMSMNILSMGMSGDYKIAIEEGSTMVRVGSAIFGSR